MQLYRARVEGREPGVIMHSTAGMAGMVGGDGPRKELQKLTNVTAAKRGQAQHHRIAQIETDFSIYWDAENRPHLPPALFRAVIEKAARMTKDGPRVRRGVRVLGATFDAPQNEGLDRPGIVERAIFTTVVKVGRSSNIRARARFYPWSAEVTIGASKVADRDALFEWLSRAGSLIGVGDWRPDCSGVHGCFDVVDLEPV